MKNKQIIKEIKINKKRKINKKTTIATIIKKIITEVITATIIKENNRNSPSTDNKKSTGLGGIL